ncbi:16S rRNA (cytidine(1402)-2'-O)-methyltransferase [hydrothermal vent metagenome]|uniref:16S rRNA (Cytidine(1402)-2'-O)-methyltransferase n=1 Tax=hydrothermal vent metagenome TaxID=652676 RepID=A0A3B1CHB3_9ZZZZ
MKNNAIENAEKGVLHIVSTPIGHLGDMTHRSVELLKQVHVIAAEDTRRTRVLLNHYQIEARLSSFHSFNQEKKAEKFIEVLNAGNDVALVTDAGTPGISDPLFHLVQLALKAGVEIKSLPGPSAVLAALTVAGLPMDRFVFEGFLPLKKKRKARIQEIANSKYTVVLYESPHRIQKTLRELSAAMGGRKAVVARELTKMYEEVLRGDLNELAEMAGEKKWKGEITLVIAGNSYQES